MAELFMIKRLKKMLCLILSVILMVSMLTGCTGEEIQPEIIVPDIQIFEDEYDRNDDITNLMTYRTDYITSGNGGGFFNNVDIVNLYDHVKIQVDSWESFTVGITTLGEMVSIIDAENKSYVQSQIDAVVAERQAVIDARYEAAKKKAEEKGKVYDEPKKIAPSDDLHFDNPYTYTIKLYTSHGYEDANEPSREYQPTLLVDPSKYQSICLDVAKYGIPYVRIECVRTSDLYNMKITQESDWVVNGVTAADVSHLVNAETGESPEIVDTDLKNKAAKPNIAMSGNISFGGEGFTWDSLMMLCNALSLQDNSNNSYGEGFRQSSDTQFTYYTIMLYTNIFEARPNSISEENVKVPFTRLVATFDPLTQTCLDWTVDCYTSSTSFSNRVHEIADPVSVNVHEYQVDTNNYEAMRNTIQSWIDENAIKSTTSYCAIIGDEIFGKVETGLLDIDVAPVINGETFHCINMQEDNGNGYLTGTYISQTEVDNANKLETQAEIDAYKLSHAMTLKFACCVLDENDKLIGVFNPKSENLVTNGETRYIASYDSTDVGYKNVKLLTNETVSELIMVYTKTYKLTAEQTSEINSIFKNDGVIVMREYVDKMFESAENAQTESSTETTQPEEETVKTLITLGTTISERIDKFKYSDKEFGLTTTTNENTLSEAGLIKANKKTIVKNNIVNTSGDIYGPINALANFSCVFTDSETVKFYGNICVGMTKDEAVTAIGEDKVAVLTNVIANDESESIVVKSDTFSLVAHVNDQGIIDVIYLLKNELLK